MSRSSQFSQELPKRSWTSDVQAEQGGADELKDVALTVHHAIGHAHHRVVAEQDCSRFWIDAPTHLASLLGKPQAEISKIENRADMLMSTLRNFVQAMGGDFEVKAVFTDCAIEISTFSLVARKPKPAKPRKQPLVEA